MLIFLRQVSEFNQNVLGIQVHRQRHRGSHTSAPLVADIEDLTWVLPLLQIKRLSHGVFLSPKASTPDPIISPRALVRGLIIVEGWYLSAAFHLALHCLQKYSFRDFPNQRVENYKSLKNTCFTKNNTNIGIINIQNTFRLRNKKNKCISKHRYQKGYLTNPVIYTRSNWWNRTISRVYRSSEMSWKMSLSLCWPVSTCTI